MKIGVGIVGASVLALLVTGCGPELAQTPLGTQEQEWESAIRKSYPSWKPPRSAPPAIKDNMSPKYTPQATAPAYAPMEGDTSIPAAASDDIVVVEEDVLEPAAVVEEVPAATEDNVVVEPVVANEIQDDIVPDTPKTTEEVAPVEVEVEYSEYTVVAGDSLSVIAKKIYNDGRRYFVILKANEEVLKGNPNYLYPGMKLRIPKLQK